MTGRRSRVASALVFLTAVFTVALAGSAEAAVTVTRAEVNGDRLRIEGRATASRPITVDGVQMATSDSSGSFRIERSGFTSPADCTVDVNDGSAAAVNVRLSGCTVTTPALSAISLSPSTVPGGATASATVTLTAPAPAGGAVVSLTSSNVGVVTVPATLTIPAGAASAATGSVETVAVTSTTTSVISAVYNGLTRTATLTVTAPAPPAPPAALDTVSLGPASVQGGSTASATVTLTAPAPAGGAVVAFASSNPAAVTVAATLTVPAGVNSWVGPTLVSTSPVTTVTTSVVSATYNGVTRTAIMTVTPPPPPQPGGALDSISLNPATVQTGTTQTSATLSFTAPTPTGGATVSLASSNTSIATVPATVTVPANSSTGAFPVTISPSAAGTATISATYSGVTRSALLTVTTQSLLRIVTQSPLPNARVGENYAGFIEACCGQGTPIRWSLVNGRVPDGLRFAGDDLRLTQTTAVTGVATRVQTTTFTVRARDQAGNTATKTFTLTVDPASPLVITNGTDQLSDATVGVAYEVGLFPGGGVPPYTWSHVAGTLPPGLSVQASPGRVRGTPTTAGTFTFTVRVADSGGQTATQQFTIRVLP
ncbi:MAG TPA: putative Ig domain-containing protein [Actinomycetes bacterium]|nr:putative Ig domain-containing protein [Actinomycetes bacterium]